jgi:hypothetical protein
MTREQFLNKVKEMLPDMNLMLLEKAEEVLLTGAFDLESYEDNYLLPKIFLSAMGEEIKFQFEPFSKVDKKTRNNIINVL